MPLDPMASPTYVNDKCFQSIMNLYFIFNFSSWFHDIYNINFHFLIFF